MFRNASGLPDPEQVTTARDMITLALRLQDDFPQHYPLFATRTFTYDGETYRNHNTLLFSYEGTDGLKTGYTRASGFNLVSSVRRGRKHVVGAVFGGATASLRNAAMRTYLNMGLMKASNEKTRRPAPRLIAPPRTVPQTIVAPAPQPAQRPVTQARGPAIEIARVRPVMVPGAAARTMTAHAAPDSIEALLARYPAVGASQPMNTASTGERQLATGGFLIQIGAFATEGEAQRQLAAVKGRAGSLLANRAGVTSAFRKDGKVFYRARYGGFEAQATAAGVCGALKRLNVSCLVMAAE
jgi:D-alanyl-D-alanine carboxypeptidase